MVWKLALSLVLAGAAGVWSPAEAEQAYSRLHSVRANGVDLHYLVRGKGEPVVFVHGGLLDYRRWGDQVGPFSKKYRVISYSRRYNFPNGNTSRIDPVYSAAVDAEDLAALIQELRLGPVHVVAESYGAYGALLLAIRHPELVRTLVLAEPPIMPWLDSTPEGRTAREDFRSRLWAPVGEAFRKGDPQAVLGVVAAYFLDGAKVDAIPPGIRRQVEANLPEWQALSSSTDAFPGLRREDVAAIRAPTLLLQGERTLALHRIIDAQLVELLPDQRRVTIPNATHEMWDEQPVTCREKTLQFLAR